MPGKTSGRGISDFGSEFSVLCSGIFILAAAFPFLLQLKIPISRVAPDIRPFLYPVSGRISGFVCRISGWPDIRPEKLYMAYPYFKT